MKRRRRKNPRLPHRLRLRHGRKRRKRNPDTKTTALLLGAAGIGAFFLIRKFNEVHLTITRQNAAAGLPAPKLGSVVSQTLSSITSGIGSPTPSASPFRRAMLGTEPACVDTRTGDFVSVSNCVGQPALSGWQSGYVRSYR